MQQSMTLIVVALATVSVVRTLLRTWTTPDGCGSGCGKCGASETGVKPGRIPLV